MHDNDAMKLLRTIIASFRHHPFFYILWIARSPEPPVEPFTHQAELLFWTSFRKPVRILVGDEIGLGKTVEAISIAKMLEERDGAGRTLVLAPPILIRQWVSELNRFEIDPKVMKRGEDVDRYHMQGFPAGWYIASIDLVKMNDHREKVLSVGWDIVIVDEAHRVGIKEHGESIEKTQRYEFMEEISRRQGINLILLSATPHRGKVRDYIERLRLIDPSLKASAAELDSPSFYSLTWDVIVFRRTKADVNEIYEKEEIFRGAKLVAKVVSATEDEAAFNKGVFEFLRRKLRDYMEMAALPEYRALPLLLALIARRASSSPKAAMITLNRILANRAREIRAIARLRGEDIEIIMSILENGYEEYREDKEPDERINSLVENLSPLLREEDIETIRVLYSLAERISGGVDSRLNAVLNIVDHHVRRGEKAVIFTEYRDTASYIYDKLIRLDGFGERAALITSQETLIPGRSGRLTIEDVKKGLARCDIDVLVSTDVASEGLNLQAANILINYEPSWSPVKIEQRIGRVWRLGQKRDVTAYTVFLGVESDSDVLKTLYKKLLAKARSLPGGAISIAKDGVVFDLGKGSHRPVFPAADIEEAVDEKSWGYSEHKAILSYLREGERGLDRYVEELIRTLEAMNTVIERIGLNNRDEIRREAFIEKTLGGFRRKTVIETLAALFKRAAELKGYKVEDRGANIFAGIYRVNKQSIYDLFRGLVSITGAGNPEESVAKPFCLVASAEEADPMEIHIFRGSIYMGNKHIYSEPVGISVNDKDTGVLRGVELLKKISEILGRVSISSCEYSSENITTYKEIVKTRIQEILSYGLSRVERYIRELEGRNLSHIHNWVPGSRGDQKPYRVDARYLGTVILSRGREAIGIYGIGTQPTQEHVRRVEEIAMRVAMDYERRMGREPRDVSMRESYDILSIDPGSGDDRLFRLSLLFVVLMFIGF